LGLFIILAGNFGYSIITKKTAGKTVKELYQMKKRLNLCFVLPVILFLFSITIISCKEPDSDPTYTIWTDTTTYSDFQDVFGELDDGWYLRFEIKNWDEVSPTLPNEEKKKWTEDQINKWFIGRGFGNYEANKETAWLITIDHGFLASRSGSIVYMLIK
jgi:hypothetical protein